MLNKKEATMKVQETSQKSTPYTEGWEAGQCFGQTAARITFAVLARQAGLRLPPDFWERYERELACVDQVLTDLAFANPYHPL
jgi:hypothetical protein